MRIFPLICLSAIMLSCTSENKEGANKNEVSKSDSLLITEESWGLVKADADLEELKKIFGSRLVADSLILGPEGMDTLSVTFINPGETNELVIHWRDSFYHKRIGFIENFRDEAPYYTDKGLKMGSTLRELLRVNGRPISFSGFGWDYGGHIMSFNGGALDSSRIVYRLTSVEELPNALYGDTELHTDSMLVQKNLDKMIVHWLILNLHEY